MARYLLVVQRLLPGGTETHMLTLAKGLAEAGHQVGVFTSGGSWVRRFQSEGVRVHLYPSFQSGATRSSAGLQQVVAQQGYQIVHAHDSAGFRLLALTPLAVRKVATVHGTYARIADVRAVARVVHAMIAVTPVVQAFLMSPCGVPASLIHMIPNGVSISTFRPGPELRMRRALGIPAGAMVIGYAGRFTLRKRQVSRTVALSLASYARRHPNVHILIAGRMSKQALGAGLGQRVHILGTVAHMAVFYRTCDIVIGTARVALEAMACAVPVLAHGESRYFGWVTEQNLGVAWRSNFGDHGRRHTWSGQRLFADLDHILSHRASARRSAAQVRRVIVRYFSNRRMVARTLHVVLSRA